ncbi:MAG: NUDIX hydrolase [Euryarchaeota archaeon]|nr:NUDIX hydrolase [Euryarchaeota archaeon]
MPYKNPRITVDGVVRVGQTILLIKRKNPPFQEKWALPGGFVEYGEKTEDAVIREVIEETGLKTSVQKLLGVYSDPSRDPRGHTITVVYLLICTNVELKSGDDSMDAKFFNIECLPELAFDHEKIISDAMRKSLL